MYERIRTLGAALRPPPRDLALGLAFTVTGTLAAWFVTDPRSGTSPPMPLAVPKPVEPQDSGQDVFSALSSGTHTGTVVAASLLLTLPLIWRRRLPVTALVVQFVGILLVHDGVTAVTFLAVLIGAYSLAAHGRSPLISMAVLLMCAGAVALSFSNTTPPVPGWVTPFGLLLPIGLFGTTIRAARARADASAQRAEALEHEQQAATRAAVADERARIAREMHDVVSHHVSVMVIQAGAAGKVIGDRPDLARESLHSIEACGREAMADLRHLFGLLSPQLDGSSPQLHPQPGFDQIAGLVANVRAAGQPVAMVLTGPPPPRGVGLVAYRVIQEALTNALRYAPGARTEVAMSTTESDLVIEVTNDASPEMSTQISPHASPHTSPDADPVRTGPGVGSGLLGLAERLRVYRGTLQAGRRLGGGFLVRAQIPVDPT